MMIEYDDVDIVSIIVATSMTLRNSSSKGVSMLRFGRSEQVPSSSPCVKIICKSSYKKDRTNKSKTSQSNFLTFFTYVSMCDLIGDYAPSIQ